MPGHVHYQDSTARPCGQALAGAMQALQQGLPLAQQPGITHEKTWEREKDAEVPEVPVLF